MTNPRSETPHWPVVAATGHRIRTLRALGAEAWVRHKLFKAAVWLRDERGTRVGLSGMAVGTDQWWAEAVLDAGLTLGAYIPAPDQPDRWHTSTQRRYRELLAQASPDYSHITALKVTVPVLHQRNKDMLNAADAVVAVWLDGKQDGGTFEALEYARKTGKPGVWIEPRTRAVHNRLPAAPLSFTSSTPALFTM